MSTSAAPDQQLDPAFSARDTAPLSLVWPSLLVALLALAGSLWLSIGLKLKACPLCFYQRTFVMGVVAVLGIGILTALLIRVARGDFSPTYHWPVEISGLYWHFVDIVWIFLYPLLYLINRYQ